MLKNFLARFRKLPLPMIVEPTWERPADGGFTSLPEDAVRWMWKHSKCCYCKKGDLYEGPSGGISTNYFCGNPDCNSRFNIASPSYGAPWGEFTGTCPDDFIARRRLEQAGEAVLRNIGEQP